MSLISYRDKWATKMGLPLSARYKHEKDYVLSIALDVHRQHPEHSWDECMGRAEARADGIEHQRSLSKSLIVTKNHNYRRWVELGIVALLVFTCLFLATRRAHGQNVTVRGVAKGTTVANTATVTANDANHNGMDVNVLNAGSGGTASSFGAAFPATGTAAGFSDGVNMLPATLDASGFLKINCAAGCVAGGSFADSSAFTFGTTTVSNTSFVVDDVATNTVAENSAGAARMNTNRILYMDISKTAANTIAIKVDGSAVTQPVSGTVAVTQSTSPWVISFTAPQHVIVDSGSTGVTNLPTTVDTNSGVKSASTLRVVLATDQPQLTNKLLVTPDSVALPANQSVNLSQVAGTTTDTNSGVKSAGTMRVVLATDQPALTNKLLVTPDSVALPANQSVNVSQINAVTPLMGNGVTGTGSPRVTLASDGTAISTAGYMSVKIDQTTPGTTNGVRTDTSGATGAAPPARAELNGYLGSGATGGFTTAAPVGDTYKNINVSTATTTLLITGVSGRLVHITNLHMMTNAANSVALIEGTGATCGTGTAGLAGGTTAASGYNFAANGGISNVQMITATTGDSLCVVTSATTQLSGGINYAIY
jgi:hypothetical protein